MDSQIILALFKSRFARSLTITPFDTHSAHDCGVSASALLDLSKNPGALTSGDRKAYLLFTKYSEVLRYKVPLESWAG